MAVPRSPLWILAPVIFLPFIAFGVFDVVRTKREQAPREMNAGDCAPGWSREFVAVQGTADAVVVHEGPPEMTLPNFGHRAQTFVVPIRGSSSGVVLVPVPADDPTLRGQLGAQTTISGRVTSLPKEYAELRANFSGSICWLEPGVGAPDEDTSWHHVYAPLAMLIFFLWIALKFDTSEDERLGNIQRPSRFLIWLSLPVPIAVAWIRATRGNHSDDAGSVWVAWTFFLLIGGIGLAWPGRGARPPGSAEGLPRAFPHRGDDPTATAEEFRRKNEIEEDRS